MLSRRPFEHAFKRGVVLDLLEQGQPSDRPIEAMVRKAAGSHAWESGHQAALSDRALSTTPQKELRPLSPVPGPDGGAEATVGCSVSNASR